MKIYSISENAITIEVGEGICERVNQDVHRLYLQLKQNPFWKDVIPAYNTVTVIYDLVEIRKKQPSALSFARGEVERAIQQASKATAPPNPRLVRVPVCYDQLFGLDIHRFETEKNMSPEKLIEQHTAKIYRVFMIGFLPGFPYMGIVDPQIALPRLQKPRTRVPAGSVGIAGEQTGIYPVDSPGGWNIIGRTPLQLFNAEKESTVFFQPGDRVKFYPITKSEFENFDSSKVSLLYES
jgi:inhibitor of KinA